MTLGTVQFPFDVLQKTRDVRINGEYVWGERLHRQQELVETIGRDFGMDKIYWEAHGFYPSVVYFRTPLTADPSYTQSMRDTWYRIKIGFEKVGVSHPHGWSQAYAPFDQTDPYSKTPDGLDSYQLALLDHIKLLTSEAGLFDLNRPSNGVGRECELALSVGMPTVGFSQNRVSRMDKGSPGMAVLAYRNESELRDLLFRVFNRDEFQTEPFYVGKHKAHDFRTVFKGDVCINCSFKEHLHPA